MAPTRRHGSNQASSFSLLTWYSTKLDTHPLLTKGITSGLVSASGDIICQGLTGTDWDMMRASRFALLGAALVAPVVHVWYGFLARRVPGVSFAQVSKRVIADQLGIAPVFLNVWLASMWTLEDVYGVATDTRAFSLRIMEAAPSMLVANWMLWIPASAFNFRFVPVKYQVLTSNIVALLWNVYLSYKTSTEVELEKLS